MLLQYGVGGMLWAHRSKSRAGGSELENSARGVTSGTKLALQVVRSTRAEESSGNGITKHLIWPAANACDYRPMFAHH